MQRVADALYDVALTLWVGGLWVIGALVAPILFTTFGSDRQLAGLLAGKLFASIGWVGLVCGSYLVLFLLLRVGTQAMRRSTFWLLAAMLVLTAVSLFGIQPLLAQLKAEALPREVMESVLHDRFATWHTVSSFLYIVQSMLGLLLVIGLRRGAR